MEKDLMSISEIFVSIDGEGIRTGYPVVFIRVNFCNLNCPYCDSKYTWGKGDTQRFMTPQEVFEEVKAYGFKRVTLTGGEPLCHPHIHELIKLLDDDGQEINIETNGAVDIQPFVKYKNVFFTLDYKTLSSGQNDKMLASNYCYLTKKDCVKCVVSNINDIDDFRFHLYLVNQGKKPKYQIFLSPVFGDIEPKEIVEYVLKYKWKEARAQLQLHKFIWDKDKRGV